jgi:hypothetical protein
MKLIYYPDTDSLYIDLYSFYAEYEAINQRMKHIHVRVYPSFAV